MRTHLSGFFHAISTKYAIIFSQPQQFADWATLSGESFRSCGCLRSPVTPSRDLLCYYSGDWHWTHCPAAFPVKGCSVWWNPREIPEHATAQAIDVPHWESGEELGKKCKAEHRTISLVRQVQWRPFVVLIQQSSCPVHGLSIVEAFKQVKKNKQMYQCFRVTLLETCSPGS